MKTSTTILTLMLIAAPTLRAQVVNDGTTNTLANVTNTITGTLTVGTNGSFTLLVLSNNVLVTNTSRGIIGLSASARSNEVRVISPTARWQMGGVLSVGSNGPFNRLVVSGGGQVADFGAIVGRRATASNCAAIVTDAGSLWSHGDGLIIGQSSGRNQLVISNGATVVAPYSYLGDGGSDNQAVVTGTGSHWTNATDFYVGFSGAGNQLTVENGGRLSGGTAILGLSSSATNNQATVTGVGSLLSNRLDLVVGQDGSNNRLVVSNGGGAFSVGAGVVGVNSISRSNVATITDPGSFWSYGAAMRVGGQGSGNLLVVSNGAWIGGLDGFIGENTAASNNLAIVTGPNSAWTNLFNFRVGSFGSGNRLVVENGAHLNAQDAFLGREASSSGNLALVTGAGSAWTNANSLYVGGLGNGNRLVISNGGTVRDIAGIIGLELSATNNEALVTDPGSLWANGGIQVGASGSRSRLVVSNAAVVTVAVAVTMGVVPSATNNLVIVDGGTLRATNFGGTGWLDVRRGTNVLNAGLIAVDQLLLTNTLGRFEFNGGLLITRSAVISNIVPFVVGIAGTNPATWDVRAGVSNHILTVPLVLGEFSPFNQLLVTNGAWFSSAGGFIGLNSTARSNTVIVAGPGSTWSNSAIFEIGSAGSFNSLVVSNGGFMRNTFSYLGQSGGNNLALVTGAGSVWSNASGLYVGSGSASNQLVVSAGGAVKSDFGYVGEITTSSNNQVMVTGTNSTWTTVGDLFFGNHGPRNWLVVSNRGSMMGSAIHFGVNSGSNIAVVTGTGSTLTYNAVNVGRAGAGNQLFIRNGGVVQSSTTTVGFDDSGSSNNVALVTDAGSVLNGDLNVGFSGPFNQLIVSNGAVTRGSYGSVGFNASGSNNLVQVSGLGSMWTNRFDCYVGVQAPGNRLVISNSARVVSSNMFLGLEIASRSNSVVVTGTNSTLNNGAGLFVGNNGRGNQLVVSGGAQVNNQRTVVGTGSSSSNNTALITGTGTFWVTLDTLAVGGDGAGNQLTVSGGALFYATKASMGVGLSSRSNVVTVTDSGTRFIVPEVMRIGSNGPFNRLIITNGGLVDKGLFILGNTSTGGSNQVVVTGAGSTCTNVSAFWLGAASGGNQLMITNGGQVHTHDVRIGFGLRRDEVVVTGAGSLLNCLVGLDIGNSGEESRLVVADGGTVLAGDYVILGISGSFSNRLSVDGGTPCVTNALGTGQLNIRNGTNVLNAGLMDVDQLLATNALGKFEFNATGYFATFSPVTLPPLSAGLVWTNKLLVDGSIEVVSVPQPTFASINVAGTDVIFAGTNGTPNAPYAVLSATNVALPLGNWESLVTNQFDAGGGFTFTNPIAPGIPQRFFRLRSP